MKLSFRRCADWVGFALWQELSNLNDTVVLSSNNDVPVWVLESSSLYSVKSFYNVVNFGRIISPIGDFLWKNLIPQENHVFLWLVLYNKILTHDNLAKHRHIANPTCVFCNEDESIQHLFFDYVVARHVWRFVSKAFNMESPTCFTDVSCHWHHKKVLLWLILLILLPCGAFGLCVMNSAFRAMLGET